MAVGLKSFGNKIIKKLQLLEKKIVFQSLDMNIKLCFKG